MPDLPLQPGAPWTCASCGRKVPGAVTQCRCGAFAPSPSLTFDQADIADVDEAPHATPRLLWWWAVPGLVGVGLLIALWVTRPAPPPPGGASEVASVADESAGAAPPVVVEEEPVLAETATTGTVPIAIPRSSDPPLSQASVDTLVAAARDGVVTVLSDGDHGTGFFAAADLVVTSARAIGQQVDVRLRLHDGSDATARVERLWPELDLALLRTRSERPASAALPLGSARTLRAGQEVIVVGAPPGPLGAATRAVVSALRDARGVLLVQTDAVVTAGHGGAPVLDRQGRVVGLTTLRQGESETLGFAVAAEHARDLIENRRPEPPR